MTLSATPPRVHAPPLPSTTGMVLARWRDERALALMLTASLLAHALVFFGTPTFLREFVAPTASRYEAVLVATPVPRFAESAAPPPVPVARPRAPKRIAPTPPRSEANFVAPENAIAVAPPVEPEAAAPVAAPTAREPEPEPLAQAVASPLPPLATPPADVAPVSPAEPVSEPKPIVAAVAPPANVNFPDKLVLEYRISSSLTDGVADFKWRSDGKQYEVESTIRATGFLAEMFVGAFKQVSRGEITAEGLKPSFFSLRRGEGDVDVADFAYDAKELKLRLRNGEKRVLALPPRLQDMQSFLFQISHEAARVEEGAVLNVDVTNARKVYRYQFRHLGTETVTTASGPVAAIHLKSEAANPEDAYEVWLAPSHHHLPVKLKFHIGRFPIEQTATNMGKP